MIINPVNPKDIPGLDQTPRDSQTINAIEPPGTAAEADDMPWYANLFMALGAWITALLGIGAVIALIDLVTGDFDEHVILIVGIFMLVVSLPIARRVTGLFTTQMCLVTILAGQGMTVASSWFVSDEVLTASLASLVITGLVIWRHPALVLSFLSMALTSIMLAVALSENGVPYWIDMVAVISLAAGSYLWLRPPVGRDWTGPAFALLLTLPVLGISMHLGEGDSRHLNDLFIQHDRAPFAAGWLAKLTILATSLDALRRIEPAWDKRRTVIAGGLLGALILAQPLGGSAATGLMVLGYLMASPAMMVLMGIAQIIAVGQFYYELDVSLLAKSGILAVLGSIALIGWWALWGRTVSGDSTGKTDTLKPSLNASPRLAIIGATAALITGIAAQAVISREAIIAEGQQILLPLAPVDPRSLMQGDYMILRLDPAVLPTADTARRVGSISLDIAEDGTVIGRSKPIEGNGTISLDRLPGASDQVTLRYHPSRGGFGRRGQLGYGIDSFFFQEGHARFYQNADYAVLRVGENGQAVLIGLADDNKQLITPE